MPTKAESPKKEKTPLELIEEEKERLEEKVTIELFKDGNQYKDDVYVAIGSDTYQVKRGIPVQVPRKVAAIIRQQELEDRKTNERIEKLVTEFNQKSKN